MHLARLIHNPTAGEGSHTPKSLLADVHAAGYDCDYHSSKNDVLKVKDSDSDFLIVAGGDGTVRKVVLEMLDNKLKHKMPIALLPLGTANNIARTLSLSGTTKQIIQTWKKRHIQKFDIGRASGLQKDEYFLEAFGFGIFPKLMKKMAKRKPPEGETPEQEMDAARNMLLEIIEAYEAVEAVIDIDGKRMEGNYLMIELMNIKSISSNLMMAPDADPGDGSFELILVPENKRKQLMNYMQDFFEGKEKEFPIKPMRVKHAKILCQGKDAHADDTLIKKYIPTPIELKVMHSLIEFLVPEPEIKETKKKK